MQATVTMLGNLTGLGSYTRAFTVRKPSESLSYDMAILMMVACMGSSSSLNMGPLEELWVRLWEVSGRAVRRVAADYSTGQACVDQLNDHRLWECSFKNLRTNEKCRFTMG